MNSPRNKTLPQCKKADLNLKHINTLITFLTYSFQILILPPHFLIRVHKAILKLRSVFLDRTWDLWIRLLLIGSLPFEMRAVLSINPQFLRLFCQLRSPDTIHRLLGRGIDKEGLLAERFENLGRRRKNISKFWEIVAVLLLLFFFWRGWVHVFCPTCIFFFAPSGQAFWQDGKLK